MRIWNLSLRYTLKSNTSQNFFWESNYPQFSKTWLNFLRESFVVDFIQKFFLNKIIYNYIVYGSVLILFQSLNKIQVYFFYNFIKLQLNFIDYNFNNFNISSMLIHVLKGFFMYILISFNLYLLV